MNFQPKWTSKPGETILAMLNEKNITLASFANKIGGSEKYVNDLVEGKIRISQEVATTLEQNIGASASFWINREQQYRKNLTRIQAEQADVWLKTFPIKDMVKHGWIDKSKNLFHEVLNYFDILDLDTWKGRYSHSIKLASFRQTQAFTSEISSVAVWLRQGEIQGEKINCAPWNKSKFENSLEEIRSLTRVKSPKTFVPKLRKICSECGVAVAIVPNLKGCSASGATKFISSKKALIVLSFRYLSDDQFWFTFFHEAGHLILHGNNCNTYIEETNNKLQIDSEEEDANLFASEVLVPSPLRKQLLTLPRTKRSIIDFAAKIGISPGIVVGQLQHSRVIPFQYLNDYKRKYSWDEINSIDEE